MSRKSTPILALLAGKAIAFNGPDEPGAAPELTAIAKQPLIGPVFITPLGIAGDEQGDRLNHGGPDMALHHYPLDHYRYWRETLGKHPLLAAPGAFGENISTTGLTESTVCLGDRFALGTALVEVSKARQPCWKQALRLGQPDMVSRIVSTRRSGWYYRVLEPGVVTAGDEMTLVERQRPSWPLTRLFGLLIAGDHKRDPSPLAELVDDPLLAVDWRERARELLGKQGRGKG